MDTVLMYTFCVAVQTQAGGGRMRAQHHAAPQVQLVPVARERQLRQRPRADLRAGGGRVTSLKVNIN